MLAIITFMSLRHLVDIGIILKYFWTYEWLKYRCSLKMQHSRSACSQGSNYIPDLNRSDSFFERCHSPHGRWTPKHPFLLDQLTWTFFKKIPCRCPEREHSSLNQQLRLTGVSEVYTENHPQGNSWYTSLHLLLRNICPHLLFLKRQDL